MKRLLILFFAVLIGLLLIPDTAAQQQGISKKGEEVGPVTSAAGSRLTLNPNFGKIPLYFIPNKGQVNEKASFYAKTSRYTLWMTKEGLVFDSVKEVEEGRQKTEDRGQTTEDGRLKTDFRLNELKGAGSVLTPGIHASMQSCNHASMQYHSQSPRSPYSPHSPKLDRDVSRLVFLDANKNPGIVPLEITRHKVNYFIGNDPAKWQKGISTSKAVLYKDIYKNIDLKVYGNESQVEYDWIVKPGGNPADIRFEYKNVKGTRIDKKGELLIKTKFGELLHKKPVSSQLINGEKVNVESYFKRVNKNTYGFKVYEFSKDYELIIDPVVSLEYSTYLGGSDEDQYARMLVDNSGQVHLTGYTYSNDFPTHNAYQDSPVGFSLDAVLTKFDSTGTGIIFSSYFGGSSSDFIAAIFLPGNGDIFLGGDTFSWDLPSMNSRIGGKDIYICRFDSTGNFLGGRYLGGTGEDRLLFMAQAPGNSNHLWLTGLTSSTDFPMINPYQGSNPGGISGYVCKLSYDLKEIEYSTYLGGASEDVADRIAVDSMDYVYVTGRTGSGDFPLKNAWQNQYAGGLRDVFLTKIEPDGSDLAFSTLLGGSGDEFPFEIVLGNSGDIYIGGFTNSTDFPVQNPYQAANRGDYDIFIGKFKSDGSQLLYSTYLGGSGEDWHGRIILDNSAYIYVTGSTYSVDFPTKDAFQSTYRGSRDAFFSILSPDGADLVYSTYFGGSGWERCLNIDRDGYGNIYLGGETRSLDLTVLNSYQPTLAGGADFFVARFSMGWNLTVQSTPDPGVPIAVTPNDKNGNGNGNTNFTRTYPNGETVTLTAPGTYNQKAFYRWTIDGAANFNRTIQVTMNKNHTVSVEYQVPVVTHTLSVQSTPGTGVLVAVIPEDTNGKGDGKTNFTRIYNQGEIVTLTAPGTFNGKDFYQWIIDGVENFNRSIQVTMDKDHAVTAVYESPPVIYLNRTQLNFGAYPGKATTGAQNFLIENTGGLPLNWAVSDNAAWLNCSPASGTNLGEVSVSVNGSGLAPGTYTGAVAVSDPHAENSPQIVTVTLTVYNAGNTKVPFGYFETPPDGVTVMSSIPVTGWVLDDIEVMSVKIYRQEGKNLVYIGDAVFVAGARPDVELAYPGYPKSYRAGWGYMMLTNFLPDGGNGTFILHAIAMDKEGHQVTLGTKTIYCDNAHAVKPFGAIDTPAQGGDVFGTNYRNQGWVLTPLPNKIPGDGHTIIVWIDGIDAGKCKYNIYRKDIAALFPGYANSNGAMAYFDFDTTAYKNGVHTIQWTAVDNAGNVDGIGSRYFTSQNAGESAARMAQSAERTAVFFNVQSSMFNLNLSEVPPDYSSPIRVRKGYNQNIKPHNRFPDETGNITIQIKELERIEIHLSEGTRGLAPLPDFPGQSTNARVGFLVVGDQLRTLPIGSTFNPPKGIFSWQPGPGFVGTYRFIFLEERQNREWSKTFITVNILPKFTGKIHPLRQ